MTTGVSSDHLSSQSLFVTLSAGLFKTSFFKGTAVEHSTLLTPLKKRQIMGLKGISVSTFPSIYWEKATNLCNAISFFTIREVVSLDQSRARKDGCPGWV